MLLEQSSSKDGVEQLTFYRSLLLILIIDKLRIAMKAIEALMVLLDREAQRRQPVLG